MIWPRSFKCAPGPTPCDYYIDSVFIGLGTKDYCAVCLLVRSRANGQQPVFSAGA